MYYKEGEGNWMHKRNGVHIHNLITYPLRVK